MRHLFLPACLCLMTWSATTGTDPQLAPEKFVAPEVLAKAPADIALSAREKSAPELRLVSLETEPLTLDTPASGTLEEIEPQSLPSDNSEEPAESPSPSDTSKTPSELQTLPSNASQTPGDNFEAVAPPLAPLHPLVAPLDSVEQPLTPLRPLVAQFELVEQPLAPLRLLVTPFETVALPLAPLHALLKPIVPRSRAEICKTLTKAAHTNNLPAPFFIRLLFQESEFKQGIISRAGAQGIAQFMPETAADVGLDNPFDPLQAIPASARLLRSLFQQFGNLGLAAAAYNAGPKRIADWLANKVRLPEETQGYVKRITGRPAENWTGAQAGSPAVKLPKRAPCQEAAGLLAWNGPEHIPIPLRNPRTPEPPTPDKLAQHDAAHGKHHADRHAGKHESKTADDDEDESARNSRRSQVGKHAHERKTAKADEDDSTQPRHSTRHTGKHGHESKTAKAEDDDNGRDKSHHAGKHESKSARVERQHAERAANAEKGHRPKAAYMRVAASERQSSEHKAHEHQSGGLKASERKTSEHKKHRNVRLSER